MAQLLPEQWAEVRRLFARACELQPEQRVGFVEHETDDGDVLREVRSLLEYSGAELHTAASSIAAVVSTACELDPDQRLIGVRLGHYKVDAIVGHGGMGAVYRAARDDGEFRQQVAIKLVRAAAQSPSTLQRFKQERQILARLAHPNIARLLDGGSTASGVPYLVMEFIEGEPITAWCLRHSLSLEERLRLFLRVCDGVAFAHRNLVVHRDLKPGNILVTADGIPKLLDFGIAKLLDSDAHAAASTFGTHAMTPEYAAPEQVRGDPVTNAVDVYALGLVLYEILTGQQAQIIPDSAPHIVARVVCHVEPDSPARLNPELAGDLDNIVRMAVRKEPERRYASVADLAHDIQFHLDGHPVSARPDTIRYRATKFLRRNRAAVAAGLVTAIMFGALALAYRVVGPGRMLRVSSVTQLTHTGRAAGVGLETDGRYVYFVERGPGRYALERIPVEGGDPQPLAATLKDIDLLDMSRDRAKLLVSSGPGLNVPLWSVPTSGAAPHRIGDTLGYAGAWSPDGETIVFGEGPALYKVNTDGSDLRKLLDLPNLAGHIRWSPDPVHGVVRFSMAARYGRAANIWEIQPDGSHLHRFVPDGAPAKGNEETNDSGVWTAGGRYYLFRAVNGPTETVWAVPESRGLQGRFGRQPMLIHSTPSVISHLAPSPDGKRVFFISGQERRQFVRFDAARGEFVPFLPGTPGRWASFSKDGRWVAYTTVPQDALWRSRPDGSEALQLSPASLRAYNPEWSPDGTLVLFSATDSAHPPSIYVIPSSGGTPERLLPFDSPSDRACWSPDGRSILFRRIGAIAKEGLGLYLMDWKARDIKLLPGSERMVAADWSPDGNHIAATDIEAKQIQIFDLGTHQWTPLVKGNTLGRPFWSSNRKYFYYQDALAMDQPIFRVSIDGGKLQEIANARQIPQSDLTGFTLAGIAPDGTPIGSVFRKNADIYALELDLPSARGPASSSRRNHAWASASSRRTSPTSRFITTLVSSAVSPPKYRISISRAKRGSCFSRLFKASSSATRLEGRSKPASMASSIETFGPPGSRLAAFRTRA
jgi:Tol biopolymer transport system component